MGNVIWFALVSADLVKSVGQRLRRVFMRSLSEMSDNDLIGLSNADDQEAFACLLGRYSSMIYAKAVAKGRICGCDVDDLSQEAAIGFFNAVRNYDASKGVEFRTYATICVENVLISAMRSYVSHKNQPLNYHSEFVDAEISDSVVSYVLSESSGDPEGHIFKNESVGSLIKAISSQLTDLEKAVISMRIKGFSYEKTAERLGISVKSVDNAIQRVRQKMKSFDFD